MFQAPHRSNIFILLITTDGPLSGEFPALTTGQITGQSIVFLLAGFETTSNTLSSLTYHLAKNPDVQDTLVDEVDDVLEAHGGRLDHETITDMPYLEACIKEALRIFPPVSRNDRMCTKDWQDEGLFIPKGAPSFDSLTPDIGVEKDLLRNADQHPPLCHSPQPRVLAGAGAF